jgi:hypothetical protein
MKCLLVISRFRPPFKCIFQINSAIFRTILINFNMIPSAYQIIETNLTLLFSMKIVLGLNILLKAPIHCKSKPIHRSHSTIKRKFYCVKIPINSSDFKAFGVFFYESTFGACVLTKTPLFRLEPALTISKS